MARMFDNDLLLAEKNESEIEEPFICLLDEEEEQEDEEELLEEDPEEGLSPNTASSVSMYLKEAACYKILTVEEERRIAMRSAAGDPDAKEALIVHNLRLVVNIAKRYQASGMPLLDLIQEGNLGLIKATEKYNLDKGCKFSTYATWWIRQTIRRGLANGRREIRLPVHMGDKIFKIRKTQAVLSDSFGRDATPQEVAAEMDMPLQQVIDALQYSKNPVSMNQRAKPEEDETELGDFIKDESQSGPEEAAVQANMKKDVMQLVNRLPEKEKYIIVKRFGLDGQNEMTLLELSNELGVTRERVRQIEKKALGRMLAIGKRHHMHDYLQ